MKALTIDPVRLAQDLVRVDSMNPPGREAACGRLLAPLLAEAGFQVTQVELAPGRPNLVARLEGDGGLPLCLSGHLDTVPLGEAAWSREPLAGIIAEGLLWGRGAADMKGGLAALTAAAVELAGRPRPRRGGLLLIYTAGEETSCLGSRQLAARGDLGPAGALLVAEPTANQPCLGHKGAIWLQALAIGKAAHGSMPHLGINAIQKAARAIARLEGLDFGPEEHPHLGRPTLNVGTIQGGVKTNIVPDRTVFTIDARVLPGRDEAWLLDLLMPVLAPEVTVQVLPGAAQGIWSDPSHPWIGQVLAVVAQVTGEERTPRGLSYFTDAAALGPALGAPPVVILGPGEPGQAHQTDEHCPVAAIEEATRIYLELGRRWLAGE